LIRAVIDTNLIISALLKPTGTVGAVLGRLREGEYEIVLSEPLLAELVDVLNRPRIKDKYGIDPDDIEIVLALLLLRGISVEPVERIDVCRDPKDNVILEAALHQKWMLL
jgi:putative PIN family toxin of toxin-antitoxin system